MKLLSPNEAHGLFSEVFKLKKTLVYWDNGQTDLEFTEEFYSMLRSSLIFADFDQENKLERFAYVITNEKPTAYFWLLYSTKNSPEETKNFVLSIKRLLKSLSFSSVEFRTTNVNLSYERWLKKFGAELKEKTFTVNLDGI